VPFFGVVVTTSSGDSHDSGRKGNGRRARFPALDADRLIEQLKNGSAV
jgi:hypothetical protein